MYLSRTTLATMDAAAIAALFSSPSTTAWCGGAVGPGLGLVLRLGRRSLLRRGLALLHRRGRERPGPVALLAHARLLAHLAAQVVELRAAHVADRDDLDLVDLRRVERERPLDADAERLLPHGERLARARALSLQDDALEDLDPAALTLDDAEVHAHGVPRLELREAVAQLGALECLDDVGHEDVPSRAAAMLAHDDSGGRPVGRDDAGDEIAPR